MPLQILANDGIQRLPAMNGVSGWRPINDPQYTFINCRAQMALFGGQSGGGKSNVLVADSAQEYDNPNFRGILLRKSFSEMTNIMDEMERIYRPLGGYPSDGRKFWRFPAGGQMRLGYMASDAHLELYTGKPVSWLGIDEAQFQTEDRVRKLFPWVATPKEYGLRDRIRLTANPSAPWLMSLFLNNACPVCHPNKSTIAGAIYGGARWKADDGLVMKTTCFIPAKLSDNPLYGDEKVAALMSQTADVRKKLLDGCWCHTEGAFFPFLNDSYILPYSECGEQWWHTHFISMDYGYSNSAAATGLYFANDNNIIFKIQEDTQRAMKSEEYAHHIAKTMLQRSIKGQRVRTVTGFADPAMDAHTGTGKSNLELIQGVFNDYDLYMEKAAKDRIGNAQLLSGKLSRKEFILTDSVPKTFESLASRKSDPAMPGAILKVKGEDLDDVLDECLIEGTMISTPDGQLPIESISAGDYVHTRVGPRMVLWSGCTSEYSQTLIVEFSNGQHLEGTGSHPIFIPERGFIPIDGLKYGDNLLVCQNMPRTLLKSFIAESLSGGIQTLRRGIIDRTTLPDLMIAVLASKTFIARFIKITSGLFRKALSCITRMKTASITILETTNSLPDQSTCAITPERGWLTPPYYEEPGSIWGKSDTSLKSGTDRLKVKRGIANTRKSIGKILHRPRFHVSNASRILPPTLPEQIDFAVQSVQQNGVETLASMMSIRPASSADPAIDRTDTTRESSVPVFVLRLRTGTKRRVFNLTVEDQPEFFANGVLVHNCLYGLNTYLEGAGKPKQQKVEDDVEKMRQAGIDEASLLIHRHRMESQIKRESGPVRMGRKRIGQV